MIKTINVLSSNIKCNLLFFNTSFRLISLTSCLNRKLDNRAHPPYMFPSHKHGRWVETKPIWDRPYTVEPIPYPRTGGRGPNGRIWNHKRGGGLKKMYNMVDLHRINSSVVPSTDSLLERVLELKKDDVRTALIALVGSGEHKRYIMATENMKVGDLIRSTSKLSKTPIRPKEGDSHPIGSLPIGTVVSCIEKIPNNGASFALSAGTSAVLIKKQTNENGEVSCVLKMPSKREVVIDQKCNVTVGRMSNVLHNKKKFRKFGEKRWLGIRPRSGRWHRKTGKHGRKIRKARPPVVYKDVIKKQERLQYFILPTKPGFYTFKPY